MKRSLVSSAAIDPSNFGKTLSTHAKSEVHAKSLEASENFQRIMSGDKKDIASCISSSYNSIVEKNRQILTAIVETIILCGRQNLALRGHDEERGNFIALLEYQAKHNPVLKDHLQHGDPRTKYTSNKIQNELIDICGDQIKSRIVKNCNSAPFFGFIADEATDAATMEQMALCLRYFDSNIGAVTENFIGFAECTSTTGENLSEAFLHQLRSSGVDLEKLRGQGYDGASNMSGKFRGVQARIKQAHPQALYTHCRAHCLNLAICHASDEPVARNMMKTVQEVAFCFNYSAKRLLRYQEALGNDAQNREAMARRTKLQSLCETRWAARADALHTFRCSFATVVEALEDLSLNYGDAKAGPFKLAITQFAFIVSLVAVEFVLSQLVPLSQMLQNKQCDLIAAAEEANTVHQLVSQQRNDQALWDELYDKAVALAASVDVLPSQPRGALRQQHRQNVPADTISGYWRRNMFLPFMDHLTTELSDRLLNAEDRYSAQFLLPKNVQQLTDNRIQSIYQTFITDLPAADVDEFKSEIRRWRVRCQTQNDQPGTIADTLAQINAQLYPNVSACLHVLLAMPVSTATAERSFSSMRRLKTYLRSTMTTSRMSGLGLMHVHREREIDVNAVVDTFSRKKDRRLALIFNV